MRKIIFTLLFVVLVSSLALAADQVTLTTYYPAPFGMYQEMRVMNKLGVGTQTPIDSLQVGTPDQANRPGAPANIAVAIKNDLWVDGKIYGDGSTITGVGGWTRTAPSGPLYATDLGDLVGIGIDAPRAKLEVSTNAGNSAIFSTRGAGVGLVVAQGETAPDTFAKSGGLYVKAADGGFGIAQDGAGATNFFQGKVGIGSAGPRAMLDVNPSLGGGGVDVLKKIPLMKVGSVGDFGVGATATVQLYGTLLVSKESGFAGKVRVYDGLQLNAKGSLGVQYACTTDDIGKLRLYYNVSASPAVGYLQVCDYKNGTLDWVNLSTWQRSGGGGGGTAYEPDPNVFID